ncbi:MAG: glycosyltransferase family 39 protein [Lachnospiraceae bacterium]|nr:glycosyltransferase family 39 protein [Lachnospiraceae bacterium]
MRKLLSKVKEKHIVFAIMLLGIFARGFLIWRVPGGLNQDEAYAGYEAYSLLHYGMDSWGYHFPVYFISWGSGMNVLESYLMIPFVAVFGLTKFAIRLPQLIVACISLYVFYKLLREIFGYESRGVYAGFLYFAVCPWHIMLSRWALESNLAPGFLLFGLYFFITGRRNPKYYMLSALFYGLSLYAYATIWVIVPFIIILQVLYLLWTRELKISRYLFFAVLILFLLALPLLLFMAVNYYGWLDEIRTPFFSVPKLIASRGKEIDFWRKRENLDNLYKVIATQWDGYDHNATVRFGLYYKWGLFVGVAGFAYGIIRAFKSIVKRKCDVVAMLLPQFIMSVILGCLIYVNINRINSIHIPIIAFISVGIVFVCDMLYGKSKKFLGVICTALLVSFLLFEYNYFTGYRELMDWVFGEGTGELIEYTLENAASDEAVYVDPDINYAKVLFYSRMPVEEFISTVEYKNYPSKYLSVYKMGRFVFDMENAPKGAVRIE